MTSPADVRDRVLVAVDADQDARRADLAALVAIPSVGGSDAESDAQDHLARDWAAAGLQVDRWEIDVAGLARDPQFPGMEVPRTRAVGVAATLPGRGDGPRLMINGHTDVVPPGDPARWTGNPYHPRTATRDGREVLLGRGACDMKAGLAAAASAVRSLRAAGARLRGDLVLAPVVGEEDGGLGTFALLRHGVTADACVVPEPTGLDLIPANGGALTFRLTVRGLATHAARRAEGISALDAFVPVLAALHDLERDRNADVDPLMASWPVAYPLSIGTVRAGDWASTVPDLLVAEGRLGVALDEPVASARAALEDAVAAACRHDPWLAEHPVEVSWWGGQFSSGRTDPGHPLVDAVARAHLAAADGPGRPAAVLGAPYGSDLRLLTGIGGIPTVQYGPGDTHAAHAADEWVPLAEVDHAARALALVALDVCGTW